MRTYENILQLVGNTPLVRLNRVTRGGAPVYAKLESFNPGGSVKDRIGLIMIDDAEKRGVLKPGGTVVEPTSGNTGLGLAMVCAIKGYKMVAVMPDKVPVEKIRLLEAYGARCVICPTNVEKQDPRSYYMTAQRLAKETPGGFCPMQYSNQKNPEAHYLTTGPEIWKDTDGKVTHFVCGMGTGGTISGTGRFLKEKNKAVKIVGIDTVGSILKEYKETGKWTTPPHQYLIDGIGEDFIPETTHFQYVDDVVTCTDKDAYTMARRLAREDGIFVGSSAGAAAWGAVEVASKLKKSDLVVVLLPDTGERYLSKLNDEWMKAKGLL